MNVKLVKLSENVEIDVLENTFFVVLPSPNNKTSIKLNFVKQGVESELVALYVASQNSEINLETIANHTVPNTSCYTSVKGILLDNSSSNYIGKILIAPKAMQTVSFLDDNVLVVGNTTKNHSEPILQIEADDVKASHGATTGRIDEFMLYYLKSRGLTESVAKNIIIEGFLDNLISKIPSQEIKLIAKEYISNELVRH